MRLSLEQQREIERLVGACELERRRWQTDRIERTQASRLIRWLNWELHQLRIGKHPHRTRIDVAGLPGDIRPRRTSVRTRRRAFWEDPDDERHGTLNGYNNLACRCDPCRDAATAYNIDYRARKQRGEL